MSGRPIDGRITGGFWSFAPPEGLRIGENRVRRKIDFASRFRLIGSSALQFRIFLFTKIRNSALLSRPAAARGALRDRHECWQQDAMDALMSRDERDRGGRRNRVVLISRRWDQVLW